MMVLSSTPGTCQDKARVGLYHLLTPAQVSLVCLTQETFLLQTEASGKA